MNGFQLSYRTWIFDGEEYPVVSSNSTSPSDEDDISDEERDAPMVNVLHDLIGPSSNQLEQNNDGPQDAADDVVQQVQRANRVAHNDFIQELEECDDSVEEYENDELNSNDVDSEDDVFDNDDNLDYESN
ncbi:Uncharacterized protein Fot_24901 [Forsythia ovata]|uniref:Transposase n=1 Tax=Forsythia ovata TaxID=205694 RepID=A0ABD1U7I7_9LAMI